ncbi:unnamed protein product [marine sediment metagenome]|uniref:Uncharacterized protein n=1 Tax=marine sediment metagenome TaxID=412755 RepID=X1PIH2_9ZZZZ
MASAFASSFAEATEDRKASADKRCSYLVYVLQKLQEAVKEFRVWVVFICQLVNQFGGKETAVQSEKIIGQRVESCLLFEFG